MFRDEICARNALMLVAKDCERGVVCVKRFCVFFIDSVLRPQSP